MQASCEFCKKWATTDVVFKNVKIYVCEKCAIKVERSQLGRRR